jgi:hypothetical protein
MCVNLLGFAHLYDNRKVLFPGCFDARQCLVCALYNLRQPLDDASAYTAHNWTDSALTPYPAPWSNPELISVCRDCAVVWQFARTHSKQKLF